MKKSFRPGLMDLVIQTVSLFLLLAVAACASRPWPAQYLQEAGGHATQQEIEEKLGPPDLSMPGPNGSELWLYRYTRGFQTSALFVCRGYRLTFDANKKLREWIQTDCSDLAKGYDPEKEKLPLKEP